MNVVVCILFIGIGMRQYSYVFLNVYICVVHIYLLTSQIVNKKLTSHKMQKDLKSHYFEGYLKDCVH